MYRCECCTATAPPRQRMLRHVVHRTVPNGCVTDARGKTTRTFREEIAREFAVCAGCKRALEGGVSLGALWAAHALDRLEAAATAPAPKSRLPQRMAIAEVA